MGLSQAFLPSQPVAKQGMRFPPGLLATDPCLLFPTPGLTLNPQSQMSHSPSPSPGTGPHQAPQTTGLGTALSQWQGDITPKGSSSVLCLLGAKKPWKRNRPESSWASGLQRVVCWGKRQARGWPAWEESWPLTYQKQLLLSRSDGTPHTGQGASREPSQEPCTLAP